MSSGGHETGGAWFPRKWAMIVAAAVFLAAGAALAAVVTVNSGGSQAAPAVSAPTSCDSYGTPWVKWFNKNAKAQGNPTRMLGACCQSETLKGQRVHHCFIKVTLAGTTVAGCAIYDLGSNGLPVSPAISVGQHQNCPLPKNGT